MSTANSAAAIAANRFGLGARPGELAHIGGDARGWLELQLKARPPLIERADLKPSYRVLAQVIALREARRTDKPDANNAAMAAQLNALYRPIYLAEATARIQVAAASQNSFVERLVHFWANHFAISADKRAVTGIVGAYEREAIRPYVLGSFSQMLLSVERHPGMLLYLDNHLSVGPNSPAVTGANKRAARKGNRPARMQGRGLNENLAREILELHTLGVGSGYTQTDVTTFAKVITGWSVSGNAGELGLRDPGKFAFRDEAHEPGAKTVLGKRYGQDGVDQGRAVLADLARHPATAKHVATKLVRHFVADDPTAAAVERVARAFLDADGNLPAVYRAVFAEDAAWAAAPVKFKTPNEYLVSAHRALGLAVEESPRAIAAFDLLGQRPWTPGSPAGWPDRAVDWDGAAAVFKRIEWADAAAGRVGNTVSAKELAPQILGGTLSAATATAIARAESGSQALTLLLASPEFMRR
jgi:uncharacterized protein (DUF1800 family)